MASPIHLVFGDLDFMYNSHNFVDLINPEQPASLIFLHLIHIQLQWVRRTTRSKRLYTREESQWTIYCRYSRSATPDATCSSG